MNKTARENQKYNKQLHSAVKNNKKLKKYFFSYVVAMKKRFKHARAFKFF